MEATLAGVVMRDLSRRQKASQMQPKLRSIWEFFK